MIGPLNDTVYPNQWPHDNLPSFRSFFEDYYQGNYRLSLELMTALEIGLKLPPNALIERCLQHGSECRLLLYPALSAEELQVTDTTRVVPHVDLGLLTLLLQESVNGLEVED